MPAPTQIFISYARKDGRELALRLRTKLQEAGLSAWLDTAEIDGGASWASDIEQAIEGCEVTLALLSHGSYVSEICRAEQMMSQDKGKHVIPVLVQADAPRPIHLYAKNYRDFTDTTQFDGQFATLLTDIREGKAASLPASRQQTPNNAPKLPENFVARPAELTDLRRAVMGDDTDRKVALTALRGMGGIGKSVMAAALCHDEIVQAAFPDGIIWLTIGRTPGSLAETMKILGTALGDSAAHYGTEAEGGSRLRDLLPHKSALIVLDDAWEAKHIEPFLADAPRCRFLFTTRDGSIALALGAGEVRLDVMKPAQAIELLRDWAGRDDEALPEIADRLGYLPLALKLAGARLREGMTGADWLNTFQHVSQIKLGRRSTNTDDNLQVCFDLSTNQLAEADRSLYFTLGIFPEDVWILQTVVIRLWCKLDTALTDFECKEILTDLARLALIERRTDDGAITLHDLLHDYTREKLADEFVPTHHALLAAYNPSHEKAWHEAADSYLCDHLVYHLIEAGRTDDLPALFANHDWMHRRFEQSGYTYTGFLDDLTQAWEISHAEALRQINADEEPAAIAQCIRYALLQTSINSIAANYDPSLVAQAVKTGLWTPERALAIAERVPDANEKVKMYVAIFKTGKVTSEQEIVSRKIAFAAALAIEDEYMRARSLATLAPHLQGEVKEQVLQQGFAAALAIEDDYRRAEALAALAPHLQGEMLQKGLAAALSLEYEFSRARALAALAPHLQGEVKEQALQRGLAAALAIRDEFKRAWALAALAPQLQGEVKEQALQQGITAVLAIKDERTLGEALVALAPQLPEDMLEHALATVLEMRDGHNLAEAVSRLAPYLYGEVKQQALKHGLDAALTITAKYIRTWALTILAPHLEGEARQQALQHGLDAALAMDGFYKARTLAILAPHLEGEARQQALQHGLDAALETGEGVLALLAPCLHGHLLQIGLMAALAHRDEDWQAKALAVLVSYLRSEAQENALQRALEAVWAVRGWDIRAEALAALVPHLQGHMLEIGLRTALSLREDDWQAEALAALAPHLQGHMLQIGLEATLKIQHKDKEAETLAALTPHLPSDMLEHALAMVLTIKDNNWQAKALAALAPHLEGEARQQALEQSLAAAMAIKHESSRAKALAALAPHLEGEARQQALQQGLAAAMALEDKFSRAEALATFLPIISEVPRLLHHINLVQCNYLWTHKMYKRETILRFLAKKSLFAPPIFSPDTLGQIAEHIIDVCNNWEWQ